MVGRAKWVLAIGIAVWPVFAAAQSGIDARRPMALGFNLDLFPTVISAVNGKLGYAPRYGSASSPCAFDSSARISSRRMHWPSQTRGSAIERPRLWR